MAKPRVPTNVLEARGAFKNHPERKAGREFEPLVTEPLCEFPNYLDPAVKVAWDEIVRQAPEGVLTKADETSVGLAATLLVVFRGDGISDAKLSQLINLLGKFGMNPADRTKIQVPRKKAANPFSNVG